MPSKVMNIPGMLLELQDRVARALEGGIRREQNDLGLRPQDAKELAGGLLPGGVKSRKGIVKDKRGPSLSHNGLDEPCAQTETDHLPRPVAQGPEGELGAVL